MVKTKEARATDRANISRVTSCTSSMTRRPSLLHSLDDEADFLAVGLLHRDKLLAGAAGPGRNIGQHAWVGGQSLNRVPDGHGLDRLSDPYDRHRTEQSLEVEGCGSHWQSLHIHGGGFGLSDEQGHVGVGGKLEKGCRSR